MTVSIYIQQSPNCSLIRNIRLVFGCTCNRGENKTFWESSRWSYYLLIRIMRKREAFFWRRGEGREKEKEGREMEKKGR